MWKVEFLQDTRTVGLGTVVATHDDPSFRYERRVDARRGTDINAFVSEAKQRLNAIVAEEGARTNIANTVTTLLNS